MVFEPGSSVIWARAISLIADDAKVCWNVDDPESRKLGVNHRKQVFYGLSQHCRLSALRSFLLKEFKSRSFLVVSFCPRTCWRTFFIITLFLEDSIKNLYWNVKIDLYKTVLILHYTSKIYTLKECKWNLKLINNNHRSELDCQCLQNGISTELFCVNVFLFNQSNKIHDCTNF